MATTALRLLSADNHIVEPPDLWTSRIESKYQDVAPRIESREDADYWIVGDNLSVGSVGNATHPGERYTAKNPHEISVDDRFEAVRKGAYDPDEALKDMAELNLETDFSYISQKLESNSSGKLKFRIRIGFFETKK